MSKLNFYEEGLALRDKAIALYEAIHDGERGIEDMSQADGWMVEANANFERAAQDEKAAKVAAALTEGQGSLTAGHSETQVEMSTDPYSWKAAGGTSFAEWVQAITLKGGGRGADALRKTMRDPGALLAKFDQYASKALEEATGVLGGYLVPIEYRPELYAKAAEAAIVRPRATVIPMTTREIDMPSLDQTITPDDQLSAFFGGLLFEWVEEAQAKPEVDLLFKMIALQVHELAGYLPVSNNLIADSAISLDALIRNLFGKCMADAEDYWYLQGDGVGKPWGVIHSPATIQVARTGANHIVWEDIVAMLHAFEPGAGVWVIHICAMEELLKLEDDEGHYMWIPNARDGMPDRLVGYPIIWTEKASALGSKGDIGLYDFSYYLIGDRQGPAIETSTHYRFRYDQTCYRISMRIDGKPWLSAPVPLRPDGTHEISPFVTLDEYGA